MKRWIALLLTILLATIFFAAYMPTWSPIPRWIGIGLAIGMVASFVLPSAVFIATSKFTPREKVAGWFYLAGAVAIISPSFFLRYMVLGYWPPWWYFVVAVCISLPIVFACFAIATRIAPVSPRWPQTNFSVATSAPEHTSKNQ
jgi:MFS family permease